MARIIALFAFLAALFFAHAAYAINDGVDFLELKTTPAPSAIVDEATGALNLGWFSEPFQIVNPDAAFRGLFKGLRKKEWQFFSFASPQYVIGFAAVDAGYLSTLFAYAFEIQTKNYWNYEKTVPGGKAASIAKNSLNGETIFKSADCSLKIENNLAQKVHTIDFDCADRSGYLGANCFTGSGLSLTVTPYGTAFDVISGKTYIRDIFLGTGKREIEEGM